MKCKFESKGKWVYDTLSKEVFDMTFIRLFSYNATFKNTYIAFKDGSWREINDCPYTKTSLYSLLYEWLD